MPVARTDLITAFPEFGDTTRYPASQVDYWLGIADAQVSKDRFGTSRDLAVMLFVAHNIVLSARSVVTAATGGAVGAPLAVASSKSVGGASISYDTSLTAIPGAGVWNATSYGQRYYQMLRAFGSGPLYRVPARSRTVSPWGWPV